MSRLMRLIVASFALVALVGAVAVVARANPAEPAYQPACRPDELLVKFQPGADPAAVTARHGGAITSVIAALDVYVVAIPPGTVEQKIAEFEADPDVDYAEPNGIATVQAPATEGGCGG